MAPSSKIHLVGLRAAILALAARSSSKGAGKISGSSVAAGYRFIFAASVHAGARLESRCGQDS